MPSTLVTGKSAGKKHTGHRLRVRSSRVMAGVPPFPSCGNGRGVAYRIAESPSLLEMKRDI